ncbi:MAG: YggT family protein [Candidatus Binatia bacterium]|nr:MAG: YggT family protein [Candidatus Binatia bacterium]
MFVIANLIRALAQVLDLLLHLYSIILIVRVIVSWVNADPFNPIVRFLYQATEPVLQRVRRTLPVTYAGFDLSPLVVLLIIFFLQGFLVSSLYEVARRL